ncbi:MAG: thioredoxin-dependent thiol peroxidase [Rickettsiales bacterium]|nr:thioredoxin-dependent thiol peroxidase [Rickettsiales bacterium]
MKIEVGKNAPAFTLPTESGEVISLSDLKGKNIVLYFYPKDDTPGCTIEAQDFTKKLPEFEALDTIILGVSKDNIKSHCKFIEKYALKITLLADESQKTCQDYDVIKEKSMLGKKYIGIERSTFLINKIGKLNKIWRGVKVNGHVEEVLEAIKQI